MIKKELFFYLIIGVTMILAVVDRAVKGKYRTHVGILTVLVSGAIVGVIYVLGIKYGFVA